MKCIFGKINDESKMKLYRVGEIINEIWKKIPSHFKNVKIKEFVIMPNHIHGIIEILEMDDLHIFSSDNACVIPTQGNGY